VLFRSVTLPVTLPAFIEGTYRILVQTDATGLLVESDEGDNIAAATDPLVIALAPSPDLVIESGSAPAAATAGTSFGARWRGRNAGTVAASGSWSDRLYLTSGVPWNPAGAIALGSFAGAPGLPEGGGYDRDVTVGLPFSLGAGTYALWVVADANGQVTEHLAEDNNVTQIGTITIGSSPLVDLEVTPGVGPLELRSGSSARVDRQVTNPGAATPHAPGARRVASRQAWALATGSTSSAWGAASARPIR